MQDTTFSLDILHEVDVLTFRKMLREVSIKNTYDAVSIRNKIADIEAAISFWKQEADDLLDSKGYTDKAVITDQDGNEFAVLRVAMTEKEYSVTPEFLQAIKALDDAKRHLDSVKAVTPFEVVEKGKGYYYKVTKP